MPDRKSSPKPVDEIETYRPDTGQLHVIIETSKGSSNKFSYNPEYRVFELKHVLPEGSTFPYDFGFIPSTRGEDGDPLDVLVLMDEPIATGCLITARLIGAITAEQTEKDGTVRNDRLLAVSDKARTHQHIKRLQDLRPGMVEEIEQFFVGYNQQHGRRFKPVGQVDPDEAAKLVDEARKRYRPERTAK